MYNILLLQYFFMAIVLGCILILKVIQSKQENFLIQAWDLLKFTTPGGHKKVVLRKKRPGNL